MRSSYLATQPCRRPPPGDPRGLGHGCPAHRSVAGSERWRTPPRWGTGVERCRYLRCCRTVARDLSGNHDVVARRDAGSQAKVSRPTSRFSSSRQGLRFSWPRTQCFFKAPCRDASARREPNHPSKSPLHRKGTLTLSTRSITKSGERHQVLWESMQPGDMVVLEEAGVGSRISAITDTRHIWLG